MMQPMPRVPPFDRPATFDDLVKLPDNLVAEILHGELHASPRPALRHSRTERSLGSAIGGPYNDGIGGPGGWWILAEPELHLGADVLVPDLAGWRRTRMPEVPDAVYATIAPDWVCEILSPSTAKIDRVQETARSTPGKRWRTPGSSTRRFRPSRCSGSRAGGGCSSARTRETRSCELIRSGSRLEPAELSPAPVKSAFAGLTSRAPALRRACIVS